MESAICIHIEQASTALSSIDKLNNYTLIYGQNSMAGIRARSYGGQGGHLGQRSPEGYYGNGGFMIWLTHHWSLLR